MGCEGMRRRVLEHVDFGQPCVGGDVCLFVGGAAGVGKSRLVFESLAELPQSVGLTIVVDDDQEARKLGTWLANTSEQCAILVVNESSPQTRYTLNEYLRGHVHRVRVISIDNSGEPSASAEARPMLSASDALKNAEGILAANFPSVPEDRRRRYAQFSRGFIRLAADMCEHDAELSVGDMGGVLSGVERYARHRLGKHLDIVCAISLFLKVGFRDEVSAELDVLCHITGYSRQQFLDAVRATRESPGFVVQAGRYWYVTPEIIAQVLFNEAWQRWAAPDPRRFVDQLSPQMFQQILQRVATHARREVRDEVRDFFREWFSQLTAIDLASSRSMTLAGALVETSPSDYVPQLRSIVEAASPGELARIEGRAYGERWGPRRTLVWLLERLVAFPEWFEDCEATLFRLALEESEPDIGNNATVIWANLFSVFLSGTAAPFSLRLPILKVRTGSTVPQEARLAFAGLNRSLQRPGGHLVDDSLVAGRLRPKDWQPTTAGEERRCYKLALEVCGDRLKSSSTDHHQLAFSVLANNLYFLLFAGMLDDLQQVITPGSVSDREARKLLETINEFTDHQGKGGRGQVDERAKEYVERVHEWSRVFRPTDFSGRLRSVFARSPWDQRFAQDVTKDRDDGDDIASLLAQTPSLLARELDWLATPEAQSADRLGFALARVDEKMACGRLIFEHAISQKTPSVLRGYVRGLVFAHRTPNGELLGLMDRLQLTHPEMAVEILTYGGDYFDALERILRLVQAGAVPVRHLAGLALGLGMRQLTLEEVNRIVPYFIGENREANTETLLAGLRFVSIYLLHESRAGAGACLSVAATRTIVWELVERALPVVTGDTRQLVEILGRLAAFDPERAAQLLASGILVENVLLRDHAEKELTRLAKSAPTSVMAAIGSALLDVDRGWVLQVGLLRDLVAELPTETVLAWVRAHGIDGARAIARHLPLPHLDDDGNPVVPPLLDSMLQEYDDEKVFVNFLAGAHSGEAWWGNGGAKFRADAQVAKQFLRYPNRRIQEWATEEMNYRLRMAELEDRDHEESVLPS